MADCHNMAMSTERRQLRLPSTHTWLLIVILLIYLLSAFTFWRYTVDDAYISARYALNLSRGDGLVFNPGERVMGYTNPSWVLFMAAVYRLGGDGIAWAKSLGLIAGGVVLYFTVRLGQRMSSDGDPMVGILTASFLAILPYLSLTAVNGLETTLFTAIILAATLLYTDNWLTSRWGALRQGTLATLLALATVTRPEGLGFAAVLVALQVTVMVKQRILLRRGRTDQQGLGWGALPWALAYLILLIPLLAALAAYYGSPMPNTFWAKTASGVSAVKFISGGLYLASWIGHSGVFLLFPLAFWPFLTKRGLHAAPIVVALAGFYTAYILYAGYDWIPGYRFLLPAMPFYFLLAGAGLVQVWRALANELDRLSAMGRWILALMSLAALLAPSTAGNRALRELASEHSVGYQQAHLHIGEWLRDETPAGSTVALMDIGLIGFVSGRQIIDIGGLTNVQVAKLMHSAHGEISSLPATAERVAEVVLSQEPDYIVLAHSNDPSSEPFATEWSHDEAIYTSRSFQESYRYLFGRQHADSYFLSLYERAR